MLKKLITIALTVLSISFTSGAFATDNTTAKASGKLVGKAAKKAVLPATLVFVAIDANAAHASCSNMYFSEEEVNRCALSTFTKTQIDDIGEMAEAARITAKYVVIPRTKQFLNDSHKKAQEFWAENRDEIKDTASETLDKSLDAVAEGFVAFDRWLSKQ